MILRRSPTGAEPSRLPASLVLLLLAGLGGGCRSIWLGGKQDVEVLAPRGTRLLLGDIPISPGPLRLRRDRDYTLTAEGGWSVTIRSRLAWEFFLWFCVADGPFELLDFVDGSAYFLDPRRIEVPADAALPRPPATPPGPASPPPTGRSSR
ncbi:MAG: hypothetical protein ACREIU_06900 [Planctomycetota bacterium]